MGLLDRILTLLPGDGGGERTDGPGDEYTEQAEELSEFWSEYDLDFTPASLDRLDDLVDAQWEKERFTDVDFGGDDFDSAAFSGIVVQLGSYLGEVLVRNLDAEWADTEAFGPAVVVRGADDDVTANAFHIAADCLREPSKFSMTYDTVIRETDTG